MTLFPRTRALRGLAVALSGAFVGCASLPPLDLPRTQDKCAPTHGVFMAGFGRADITPPPGLGLQGYGPEGQRARGHRHRLYARALVLQDTSGERIAIVVPDLPQVSAVLQRETVSDGRMPADHCIGADRLLLAATHTHAGPGHFFMARLINEQGSSVAGFDTTVVNFLADRFAKAIRDAVSNLEPAAAAWGSAPVWGHTRNRSLSAYLRNQPVPPLPTPPPGVTGRVLLPIHLAVDPTLAMLRVDYLRPGADGTTRRPAGAFSVFAMHQTGNPSANDLYDADIFALVERAVERHIDLKNGLERPEGAPRGVHLIANGTEGDVSPDWPDPRTCPSTIPQRIRRPVGPRTPPPPTVWNPGPSDALAFCLAEAREYVDFVGNELGKRAIALFESLEGSLSENLEVSRAFDTVRLRGNSAVTGICDTAAVGTSTIGGGADGRTRLYKWKVLGFITTGLEEGGHAVAKKPRGCHEGKRIFGGRFQPTFAGDFGFPHVAQLMAVQVGSYLIGAVPWEVTTAAGIRIKSAMQSAAEAAGDTAEATLLVGLANGYLQYLTTAEEYALQRYEGGSNLYGPGTEGFVSDRMAGLAKELFSPPGRDREVESIKARPGAQTNIFPKPDKQAPPIRQLLDAKQSRDGDTVTVRWKDAYPGDLRPDKGPLVRIERDAGSGVPAFVIWDDDGHLEIRAVKAAGRTEYLWEARWSECRPGELHRFVLLQRAWKTQTLAEVPGEWFRCS